MCQVIAHLVGFVGEDRERAVMLTHHELAGYELIEGFVDLLDLRYSHIPSVEELLLVAQEEAFGGMALEGREALRQYELEIGLQQHIELARFGAIVVFDDLEHAESAQAVRSADFAQLTNLTTAFSIKRCTVKDNNAFHTLS